MNICWISAGVSSFVGAYLCRDILDKAIYHGKEKRKKYRGSKAVDHTCRNHGRCEWCRSNRLYKFKKAKMRGTEWTKLILKE